METFIKVIGDVFLELPESSGLSSKDGMLKSLRLTPSRTTSQSSYLASPASSDSAQQKIDRITRSPLEQKIKRLIEREA